MNSSIADALKSAALVWLYTTLGLWIPGLLGWIHEVTQWAEQRGAPAFPDPSNLAYLFVAALTGAFPAAIAGIVRLIENLSGKSLLPRTSSVPVNATPQPRPDAGAVRMDIILSVAAGVVLAVVLVVLLT